MTALRWLLSAALAVPVGYCLLRCVGPGHAADPRRRYRLVSGAADLAMSLTMITALWTVRLDDRAGVLPAAFAATAAWYLTRAVAGHTGPSRIELLHKAVAPAAMFWMLLSTAGDPSHAAGGMPGMALPAASTGPGRSVSLGFAGYLAFAALWWLRDGLRRASSAYRTRPVAGGAAHPALAALLGPLGDAGSQTLMAAAMSLALLVSM